LQRSGRLKINFREIQQYRHLADITVFAKVRPFLNQLRKLTDNPDFMANLERFVLRSKAARKRLQLEIQGSAVRRKTRK